MFNLAIRNRFHRSSTSLEFAAMAKSQPDVGMEGPRGGVLAQCDMSVFKSQAVSPVLEHLRGTAGFALMRAAAAAAGKLQKNNNIKSSQDGLATATEVLEAPSLPYLLTLESLAPRARLYGFDLQRPTALEAEGSLCLHECAVSAPPFMSPSRRYDIAFVIVNLELFAVIKDMAIIWRFDVQVHCAYEQVVHAGTRRAHITFAELQDTITVIAIVFGLPTKKSLDGDLSSHEVVVRPTQSLQDPVGLFNSRPRWIFDSSCKLLGYPTRTCSCALPPAHDPVAAIEQFKVKFKPAKRAGGARRLIRSSNKKKENISKVAKNKKRSDKSNATVDALQVPHLSIVPTPHFSTMKADIVLNITPDPDLPVSCPNTCIVPNFLVIVALGASFHLACIIVFSVTTSITPSTKIVIKGSNTKTVKNATSLRIAPQPVSPPCTNSDSHTLAFSIFHPSITILDHLVAKSSRKPARIIAGVRRTSARRPSKAPSGGAPQRRSRKCIPPRGAPPSTRRPLASLQEANANPRPAASPTPAAPAPDVWAPPPAPVGDAYPAPTRPPHPATSGLQATMDSILAHDAGVAIWSTPFFVGPAQLPVCAPASNPQAVNRPSEIAPSCDPPTPVNREEPVLQHLLISPLKKTCPSYRNTLPSVQMKQLCAIRDATKRG